MAVPDRARELELVGKVDFQIALAKSDTKLEGLLAKFLAPLLLKLASPHVDVRTQVIKTCEHVNVRVRGAPSLKLPVVALLQQFRDIDNSLVRQVDLQYIKLGLDRLPQDEKLQLVPVILSGIAAVDKRSSSQSAAILSLFIRLLPHVRLPPRGSSDDTGLRAKYKLSEEDADFLSGWLAKLLLYQGPLDQDVALSKSDIEYLSFNDQSFWSLPGRIEGNVNLSEARFLAAKVLMSGVFTDKERLIPALIASADSMSRISEAGQDMLKRALPAADMEDETLINSLFRLYLGSPPDHPAPKSPLKQKLLSVLAKSALAARHKDAQNIVRDAMNSQAYGLENNKLKAEAFAFVIWMTRVGGKHFNTETLISEIKDLINSQGWPKPQISGNAQADKALFDSRVRAYETIGLLMKSGSMVSSLSDPSLHPIQLVRWLFTSLAEDSSGQDVSLSIESAISNAIVAVSVRGLTQDDEAYLFEIFNECFQINVNNRGEIDSLQTRTLYPALRFVNKCLPFSSERARFLNLLALSRRDARHEVQEEAKNGLDPYLQSMVYQVEPNKKPASSSSSDMPDFHRLVTMIAGSEANSHEVSLTMMARSTGVTLCKDILLHEALKAQYKPPVIDQHWRQNITAAASNDEHAIKAIKQYITEQYPDLQKHAAAQYQDHMDEENPLKALISEAFRISSSPILLLPAAESLLTLLTFSPRHLYSGLASRSAELRDRAFSNDSVTRTKIAHVFGILKAADSAANSDTALLQTDADVLFDMISNSRTGYGAEINKAAGALLLLSYWFARLYSIGNEGMRDFASQNIHRLSQQCVELFNGKYDKTLTEASALGLSQLALFEVPADSVTLVLDDSHEKNLENLVKLASSGNENAVNAIGYLSLALKPDVKDEKRLQKLIDIAFKLHETRQPELQFAVGAAFTIFAFDRRSKALVGKFDLVSPKTEAYARKDAPVEILDKVLDGCKNTKPALRQASAIWLLCLVRDGGHTEVIKNSLPSCQLAFKSLLGDKDSLNQETGSMGLGMVYEQGGEEIKGELIKDLIGTFTETKSSLSGGNVTDETQLFEAGALPTENGQSVTTYKDIINLANEVGDPGLVYRFMSLAANSSIWSSRAAFGRFGLSQVLSDASVDGYLASNPKLYSSLYRYRFDPNPNVQRAMNDIWTALVKDPVKVIDEHFEHIVQDLLKTITGKEWRTRQASCAALGDLLQGRALQKYEGHLNEIWTQTFKVCDDIKGSVRTAAMALARVLTGIVTRTLEGGEASERTANSMLHQVVPFLLGPSGIEATAKESQAFALLTLLDIIKKATTSVLRPYIPELVGSLLPLLSSLEPEAANYLHLNADKYKITTQDLDDMRTSAVKASPMMEAIERCLDKLDESSMEKLVPSLAEATKTVIGLPSRVGVSRVLISLATRRSFLFKPYAGQFLIYLRNKHVTDRNDTVATSAAAACGYLARLADDKDILKAVEWSEKKYFNEEDERYRIIAGEVVHALSKYATDRFSSLASSILPFVYLAKHDTLEAAADIFKAAWEESVAGNRAVLLHLREIVSLCQTHLDSPRWPIKHASALTIADAVQAAGSNISEADAQVLWPALEKALAAKTWTGKEKVLDAMVLLTKRSNLATQDKKLAAQMQKIIIREAKRNNEAYKPHALTALTEFMVIAAASETDWFETVSNLVDDTLEQLTEAAAESAMDVDSKSGGASSKILAHKTMACALKALFTSLNPKHREGPSLKDDLQHCLAIAKRALEDRDRDINETFLESAKNLFKRLRAAGGGGKGTEQVLKSYVPLLTAFGDAPEQSRLKAVEAAEGLAELGEASGPGSSIVADLSVKAKELAVLERNDGIRRKWIALQRDQTGG